MNYLELKIAGILERVNPFIADDIVKILSKRENRGDRIRTCDFLVPNQALYQAELRPGGRRP